MNKTVKIGDKLVGEGQPTFIVVELGVCHEQNLDLAKSFIEKAKIAGADAVKVEAFQTDDFVLDRTMIHKYGTVNGEIEENYYELLKRLELDFSQIKELKEKADEVGILFFSTVHDKEDTDFFEDLGVCAYKIASVDMTHLPLIRHLAKKGKPVFMDTGAAYTGEIDEAIRAFEAEGFEDLIIMHNPMGYPAPANKTDLRMIPALQDAFDIPVGLSCHTPGFDMVVASTAIGSNVIEKPVTRDNAIIGPEHIFAYLADETDEYVKKVRNTETCMGNKRRSHIPDAAHGRAKRRGVYAKSDLKKGHVFNEDDLLFRVPNKGIASLSIDSIIGKKLNKDLTSKTPLQWADLD